MRIEDVDGDYAEVVSDDGTYGRIVQLSVYIHISDEAGGVGGTLYLYPEQSKALRRALRAAERGEI